MSFIKSRVGTLQGLQACLFWVPTRQEDVLISRRPKVRLNLLNLDLKKKCCTEFICFVVFSHLSFAVLSLGPRAKQSHINSSQYPNTWGYLREPALYVSWERKGRVLCQPNPCYKSFSRRVHSRSNVQACFGDALLRSETCQTRADLNDKVW